MGKTCIIAEKPSVARDIAKVLGVTSKGQDGCLENSQYVVTSAIGHLVENKNPDELNEAWAGHWDLSMLPMLPKVIEKRPVPKTSKQLQVIKRALDRCDSVICATDAAREGVLIFRLIYDYLKCDLPYKHLWASDMTKDGLKKAFKALLPAADKMGVAHAGACRSEADWLVGMNATRLFTKLCGDEFTSIGRVQTPVLALLVKRRLEIDNFVPEDYFTLHGRFAGENGELVADWRAAPYKGENGKIENKIQAQDMKRRCEDAGHGVVLKNHPEPKWMNPPLPHDLASLQKEANVRFGYSAKKTLELAQNCYETLKILSYPRTDSRYLSNDLFGELPGHLRAAAVSFPEVTKTAILYIKKMGTADKFKCVNDAKIGDHHAIIPTTKAADLDKLPEGERNIYELATRQFLAAFMDVAHYFQTTVEIGVLTERFFATGKVFKGLGWLEALPWKSSEDSPLPALRESEVLKLSEVEMKARQTKPPAHYTDATLLTAMQTAGKNMDTDDEELLEAMKGKGLGTAATRAATIETVLAPNRGFAHRKGKSIIATDKGVNVIDLVEKVMPVLSSAELTAQWEARLVDMENGQNGKDRFMADIHDFVRTNIEAAKGIKVDPAKFVKDCVGTCPLCGKPVRQIKGGHYGCLGFRDDPKCQFMIYKEKGGAKITPTLAKQLLDKGVTARKVKATSAKGNEFEARLTLVDGKVGYLFDDNKKKKTGAKKTAKARSK